MDELITNYRYIRFEKHGPLAVCINIHHGTVLGYVEYEPKWNQYVYTSEIDIIYSADCLDDISSFLRQLNNMKDDKNG